MNESLPTITPEVLDQWEASAKVNLGAAQAWTTHPAAVLAVVRLARVGLATPKATANLNENTWPVDPAEPHEAIRGRVIDLIGDRPATQEVVDMIWSLLYHEDLGEPAATS